DRVGVEMPAAARDREEHGGLDLADELAERLGLVRRRRAERPASRAIAEDAHARRRLRRGLAVKATIDLDEERQPIDRRAPDAAPAGELRGLGAALAAVHPGEPRDARG